MRRKQPTSTAARCATDTHTRIIVYGPGHSTTKQLRSHDWRSYWCRRFRTTYQRAPTRPWAGMCTEVLCPPPTRPALEAVRVAPPPVGPRAQGLADHAVPAGVGAHRQVGGTGHAKESAQRRPNPCPRPSGTPPKRQLNFLFVVLFCKLLFNCCIKFLTILNLFLN